VVGDVIILQNPLTDTIDIRAICQKETVHIDEQGVPIEVYFVGRVWMTIDELKVRFLPLLSIGRCIELLQHKDQIAKVDYIGGTILDDEDVIDTLWQAVKEVL